MPCMNSLITGLIKHGEPRHALELFQKFQAIDPFYLNAPTYAALLMACAMVKEQNLGFGLHTNICCKGFLEEDAFLHSSLIEMYAKCGAMSSAEKMFEGIPRKDTICCSAMIAGCTEHGYFGKVLTLAEEMRQQGISPHQHTIVCILKACSCMGTVGTGEMVHIEIVKRGFEQEISINNALLDMYGKLSIFSTAQEVFDGLLDRDVVSWTSLITRYVEHGYDDEALHLFEGMHFEGISPDASAFIGSLKACADSGILDKGWEIHGDVVKKGMEKEIPVGNVIVDMYGKCGLLAEAHKVFDGLPLRTIIPWTLLATDYAEHGCIDEAIHCFENMQENGISLDAITYVCSLRVCSTVEDSWKGRMLHADIVRKGFESAPIVGNMLVNMYGRSGFLVEAQNVFDYLLIQDVISWTSLISGYSKRGFDEEALYLFEEMQKDGIPATAVTCVLGLKASSVMGTLFQVEKIHVQIVRKGFERQILVGNVLVDAYVNCGALPEAQKIFDVLPMQDMIAWNALIAGYAEVGDSANVFHVLSIMISNGMRPDVVTLLSILKVCSHSGLIKDGLLYFRNIQHITGFVSIQEHCTCMIDLFGRSGTLEDAIEMTEKMPYPPGIVVWQTLLAACRNSGNANIGRTIFQHAMRSDEISGAAYVCMHNIFAGAGMQEAANDIRALIERGMQDKILEIQAG